MEKRLEVQLWWAKFWLNVAERRPHDVCELYYWRGQVKALEALTA